MKIGVLGAGRMTGALVGRWVRAGHEVMIAGRSAGKAVRSAREFGACTGREAMAAVVIRELFGGTNPTTTFQLAVADGIR